MEGLYDGEITLTNNDLPEVHQMVLSSYSTPNLPSTSSAPDMTEDGTASTPDLPLLGMHRSEEVGQPPGLPSASFHFPGSMLSSPLIGPRVITPSVLTIDNETACSTPQIETCSLNVPAGCNTALLQDSKSETGSVFIPICRICHSPEEEESGNNLISPCRCSGTLKYIHQACLMKWLEISSRKSRKTPKCELCHYQFIKHKKFRFSHWRFPRVSRQDKVLHVVFMVNLVIMIGCAIATVMCFLSDKGQISRFGPDRNKADLTSEEIMTLSCGVLFFVSFFIAMAVQIKAKHTVYQLFVKCIMQNMEWEIDEYDHAKDSAFKPVPVSV